MNSINILISGPVVCGKSTWINNIAGKSFNPIYQPTTSFTTITIGGKEIRLYETNTTSYPKDVVFHGMIKCYSTLNGKTNHQHPHLDVKSVELGLGGSYDNSRPKRYIHQIGWEPLFPSVFEKIIS